MKKFIMVLALMLVATSVSGADNLHQYYGEQGEVLPSVSERVVLADQYGITGYTGTYSQNVALLSYLQESSILGITIPKVVALFETSLRSKITPTATSATLVKGTDKVGNALSGTIGFVIDEGTTSEEFVLCTATGTALTSCTRGIDVVDGETAVTALQFEHRRGASVKISNFPQLAILSRVINGDEGIPNLIYYDTELSFGSASSSALVHKGYADAIANQGAATSTETVAGISELATQAEMTAGTLFDGDNPHVINSEYATSTPDVRGNYIPVADTDGYLKQEWIDTSEDFAFTGDISVTGTSTLATSTQNKITLTATSTDYMAVQSKGYIDSTSLSCDIGNINFATLNGTNTKYYSHSLGSSPTILEFSANATTTNDVIASSEGYATSSAFTQVYTHSASEVGSAIGYWAGSGTGNVIYLTRETGASYIKADLSAATSTGFSLDWTDAGTGLNAYVIWKLCK